MKILQEPLEKSLAREYCQLSSSPRLLIEKTSLRDPLLGVLPFKLWDYQANLLNDFQQERLIIILKARQLGISWLVCGYALWHILFNDGANVLIMREKEDEAKELLDRVRFMAASLPVHLRPTWGIDHATMLTNPARVSRIRALPATEYAGSGEAGSLVIMDEWDKHPFQTKNFTALKPTIDAGGQFIGLSTVVKEKVGTTFKQLYSAAPDNGWHKVFLPWNLRPGRDEEWYRAKAREASMSELMMEQEYPTTEEEALSPSQARAFFDVLKLRAMIDDALPPIETRPGGIEIFKKPMVGGRYVIGIDVAEGIERDASAITILDYHTGEQVAVLHHDAIAPDELAYYADKLGREYNNARMMVERNKGEVVCHRLVELDYPRLFYESEANVKARRPGWITTTSSRQILVNELGEAVRQQAIRLSHKETLREMLGFIWLNGKPQAREGALDDLVISTALAWQMKRRARWGGSGLVVRNYA